MNKTKLQSGAPSGASEPAAIVEREKGLRRDLSPQKVAMIGLSTFGAQFAWLITLLTHVAFRRFHKRLARPYLQLGPPGPWASLLGLGGLVAVLVSTWWVPGFRITLQAGAPWLALVTVCYFAWGGARSSRPVEGGAHNG